MASIYVNIIGNISSERVLQSKCIQFRNGPLPYINLYCFINKYYWVDAMVLFCFIYRSSKCHVFLMKLISKTTPVIISSNTKNLPQVWKIIYIYVYRYFSSQLKWYISSWNHCTFITQKLLRSKYTKWNHCNGYIKEKNTNTKAKRGTIDFFLDTHGKASILTFTEFVSFYNKPGQYLIGVLHYFVFKWSKNFKTCLYIASSVIVILHATYGNSIRTLSE